MFQGERLIKLAEMCRRLETEEEKVLPFYASSLTAEEKEDGEVAISEPPNEKLAEVILFMNLKLKTIISFLALFKYLRNYV